jgi:hypothetical protein
MRDPADVLVTEGAKLEAVQDLGCDPDEVLADAWSQELRSIRRSRSSSPGSVTSRDEPMARGLPRRARRHDRS